MVFAATPFCAVGELLCLALTGSPGIERLRPVLITVGATILALFPLASYGDPPWKPVGQRPMIAQRRERFSAARVCGYMGVLALDWRYALRILAKKPGFTLTALTALALGIGANTAVFSLIRGVLLRDLPYRDPARLVAIWESNVAGRAPRESTSPPNFRDWRDRNRCFEDMAAMAGGQATLPTNQGAEFLFGSWVTTDFFDLFGAKPAMGRGFDPEDSRQDVVVLSDALWTRQFGRDPQIIGRRIRFSQMTGSGEGAVETVIGVMPAGFQAPNLDGFPAAEFWVPHLDNLRAGRRADFLRVFARLKRGVSTAQSRSEMSAIAARLADEYPAWNRAWTIRVTPLEEAIAGGWKRPLWLLLGSAALLLLIACANVANLSLARARERRREFAIRAALGGGASRLLRQLLLESFVLAMLGGAAGLLLAVAAFHAALGIAVRFLPNVSHVNMDWTVLLFTLLTVCATTIFFGILPAREAARVEWNVALKSARGPAGRGAMGGGLAAAEIALTLMLLAATGLLLRSFWQVESVPLGFAPSRLLTATIRLPGTAADAAPAVAFLSDFLARVNRIPGVVAAGAISAAPLAGHGHNAFLIEGRPAPPPGTIQDAILSSVAPGYFQAMQIPLRRGRFLTPDDTASAKGAVLISEGLARRYFPKEDPLGHRLGFDGTDWFTIEGIVGDVHEDGAAVAPSPEIYVPHAQLPALRMALEVRSVAGPETLVAPIRALLRSMNPDLPMYSIETVDHLVADSVAPRRLALLLIGGFAMLALVVASIGIYGVISYAVSARVPEFGLRMALGAAPADLLRLVMRRGVQVAAGGIAAGALGSMAVSRLVDGFLFGVSGHDPWTFAAVAAICAVVALLACLKPALRAMRIDPMAALRRE